MGSRETRWTVPLAAALYLLVGSVGFAGQGEPEGCESRAACVQVACEGLHGAERSRCKAACRQQHDPPIGTLAYMVIRCRADASGVVSDQEVRVQRGYCAPRTVVSLPVVDAPNEPLVLRRIVLQEVCRRLGRTGGGGGADLGAPLNRVIASPDGSRVVFHVSDDDLPLNLRFPYLELGLVPPGTTEGFFVVNSDGSGLRSLGYKVRVPAAYIIPFAEDNPAKWDQSAQGSHLDISPNGRLITFVDFDMEAGSAGDSLLQVMTLDIDTGERQQLTDLRFLPCSPQDGDLELVSPKFVNDRTIAFAFLKPTDPDKPCSREGGTYIRQRCTVRRDGSRLACEDFPTISGIPINVDPRISFSRGRRVAFAHPVGPSDVVSRPQITEIFARNGRDILQLTNLEHADTRLRFVDRGRVFFITSANPVGRNPFERCEFFSVGFTGKRLRQVTSFNYDDTGAPVGGATVGSGCVFAGPPGCAIGGAFWDRRQRTLIFATSCDLFQTGASGEQFFAMRRDGSDLRQLTHAGGCVGDCGGATGAGFTMVELPGFLSHSPALRRSR